MVEQQKLYRKQNTLNVPDTSSRSLTVFQIIKQKTVTTQPANFGTHSNAL